MREQGVYFEQEDNAAGFLGFTLGCDEAISLMEMKQVGLINFVLETIGLYYGTEKKKFNPSESSPLVKDAYGPEYCGIYSYRSVVGMLLYISGHTHTGIAYAVNYFARYMFCPKNSHITALKRIGRYLKETRDRGFILNPSYDVRKLDFYPDADFPECMGINYPQIQLALRVELDLL